MSRIEVRYENPLAVGVPESRWLDTKSLLPFTAKVNGVPARARPLVECGVNRWSTHSGIVLIAVAHPTGEVADASKEGRKIGKVRMDLVVQDMPRAIEALARVMTWALADKGYKESDWLTVPDGINKYHGGLHRHDNKEMRGQTFDDESGLHHAIHTAWNAMARVELILREEEAKNA